MNTDISVRQQRIGIVYGLLGFAIGSAVIFWLIGSAGDASRFNRALWLYLSAHMSTVGPVAADTPARLFDRLGLVHGGARSPAWHVVPVLGSLVAAIGCNLAMGRTKRGDYIAQNSLVAGAGYMIAALGGLVVSNAAPAITTPAFVLAGGFLALAVGSRAVSRATSGGVPIIGITSLGTLVLIGVIIIAIGFVILRVLLPVAMYALVGALGGGTLVYSARNYLSVSRLGP